MWSFNRAVLAALAVMLTGCGFQARTSPALPEALQTIYIQTGDRYSPFYKELNQQIRNQGLAFSDSAGDADAVLNITRDETGQRLLSVSAQNKPTQYEVYYIVDYSVTIDAKPALENQTLIAQRNYNYDETQVLGKRLEEQSLRNALARDLVGSMIRRLGSLESDELR